MPAPLLSIIVPTLNERATIPLLLSDLARLETPHEIVVADGGSTDDTAQFAAEGGAIVVRTERGRGTQLREGCRRAKADVLCALHADVRLSPAAIAEIDAYARTPMATALAFSLEIDGPGPTLRLIAAGANLRSRLLRLPYGDQGLLMTRAMYDAAGGFPAIPLMEDVVIARQLQRTVGITLSPSRVLVSSRRWARRPLRRSFRNLALLAAFLCGVSPARLVRAYGSHTREATHG